MPGERCEHCAAVIPPVVDPNGVYFATEAAVVLRCALSTVYALANDGQLLGTRVGRGSSAPWRFTGAQLLQYLNGGKERRQDKQRKQRPKTGPTKVFAGINDQI